MDQDIKQILEDANTVAIVGLSDNPDRASYGVARYLLNHDYKIIPVNPLVDSVMGRKSYPNLRALPEPPDVVDIFRRSEHVMPIVEEAIAVGAHAVWMQLGVINEEAAAKAREHGLRVVMDRCMKIEHQRLIQKSRER